MPRLEHILELYSEEYFISNWIGLWFLNISLKSGLVGRASGLK